MANGNNGAGRVTLSSLKSEIDFLRGQMSALSNKVDEHLSAADVNWLKLDRHMDDEERSKVFMREKMEQNDQFHRDLQPLVDGIQGLSMFGQMVSKLAKIGKPLAYLMIFFMSIVVVIGQWGQKAWMVVKAFFH